MRTFRWPAIVLIVAAMVTASVYDVNSRPTEEVDDSTVGAGVPASISEEVSSWFCAAGRLSDLHSVEIVNPTDEAEVVLVTVFGQQRRSGKVRPPQTIELVVGANSLVSQPLSEGMDKGMFVSAAVETPAGFIVEHSVFSEFGSDTQPCVDRASDTWHEPWGATDRGGEMTMVLFNPFPEDAVVDMVFATENGVRESLDFRAVVVPGKSVTPLLIGSGVVDAEAVATQDPTAVDVDAGPITVAGRVSATVSVRSGRLIAERLQTYDGSGTSRGMVIGASAPSVATAWSFPVGTVRRPQRSTIVVYNPTEESAEVDVEILPNDPTVAIEPFRLKVLAGHNELVDLSRKPRLRGVEDYSVIVRSLNGVGVVASRVDAGPPEPRAEQVPGLSSTIGSSVMSSTHLLALPLSEESPGSQVVLANVDFDAIAVVEISHVVDGRATVVAGLEAVELGSGRRIVLDLEEHDIGSGALLVESTVPIVVGREVLRLNSRSVGMGVPGSKHFELPGPVF
ncbi:MAG: hypothetical protein IH940_03680 [Acidobacteria bacterium]|nr:hypothetical protein [Acidobacteriota bacterium]